MKKNEYRKKIKQVKPYIENMNRLFLDLYNQFQEREFLTRKNVPNIPGIYVFYEEGKPIYVGRAKDIKKRIQLHTRPSSDSQSANFAFNTAKIKFAEKMGEMNKNLRKELIKNPEFKQIFDKHKENLSASMVKCIKIENDIIQAMFEPYLSLKLGTYPHNNTFETH
jgi:predicted GIY-YIG superfamily endonuclease